jgi:hypothetical protein
MPLAVGNGNGGRAVRHRIGDAGDLGQRARHGMANDDGAHGGQRHRHHGEPCEQPYERIELLLQLDIDALGASIIDGGEGLQIFVERRTHAAVGLVVAPLATFRRTDFRSQPHQLVAEVDELLNALGELLELPGVVGTDPGAPFLRHLGDSIIELEQEYAEAFRGRNIRRHVDAARFHDHGINQSVDPLDVLRSNERVLVLTGERRVLARVEHRDAGQHHRCQCQKGKDSVKFGDDGQLGHGCNISHTYNNVARVLIMANID